MDMAEHAKRYYQSYLTGDRAFLEENLAADFTFTSPYDDAIGRDAYFRRCWPTHAFHRKNDFLAVMAKNDMVLTVYRAELEFPGRPSVSFTNADCMRFENGKLKSVQVFFGDPPLGLTRAQFAEQSGAGDP